MFFSSLVFWLAFGMDAADGQTDGGILFYKLIAMVALPQVSTLGFGPPETISRAQETFFTL
jgi:hypothetical protein